MWVASRPTIQMQRTVERLLINSNLSSQAIAGIFVLNTEANYPRINSIAQTFNIPVRLFDVNELNINRPVAETLALQAVGATGRLVTLDNAIAIASAPLPINVNNIGQARGKLAIVGTGPGWQNWMSKEVKEVLQTSTDWVGYKSPGISAMQAAAVGAPLGHNFCAISLSDILKPWSVIAERIVAAAKADFV
ncbi:MAG: hypothetical protein ACFCU7_18675 [Pleurocapsa sp.]